jgi:hypothetical protein
MSDELRVLATRCGSCGCGCPTIMEGPDDTIVVVGSVVGPLIETSTVKEKTGAGEAAVTIPKSLLLEAFRSLQA